MSDGLIWAGIGQGLSTAGSTMANFLYKDIAAQEDREARRAARMEELQMRLADKAEAREFNADLKRELAAMKGGGDGKGGGGLNPEDYAPGGKMAGMLAGKLGMTEPEYNAFYNARKTGDFSAYEKEETTYGDMGEEQKIKRLPAQFREFFNAKNKALADIEESYALGSRYDDVTKGRQTAFQTRVGEEAYAKPSTAAAGGQAVAASEGKPLVNVEGGMQYNQYTGEGKTTPVGESQIAENRAQAGAQGALAKKYGKEIEKIDAEIAGGMFNKNNRDRLTTMVNSANATIKSLTDGSKGNTPEAKAEWQRQYDDAVALRDRAMGLLKGSLDEKANPPTPNPTPNPTPKPEASEKPPAISSVQGAPAGATIGSRTDKGWEVKDKNGKLLGYVRNK